MAKYKIGVCCTFGAGSSLMLKMNLDSVFKKMQYDAEVEVYDISSVTGMKNGLDDLYKYSTGDASSRCIKGFRYDCCTSCELF